MKKIIIVIIAVIVIAAVAAGLIFLLSDKDKDKSVENKAIETVVEPENIFECQTYSQAEKLIFDKNMKCEWRDGYLCIYDMEIFGCVGFCMARYDESNDIIGNVEFSTSFDSLDTLGEIEEAVKKDFIRITGADTCDYEYIPIGEELENLEEKDFLEERATKDLYFFDDAEWNASLYITNGILNVRVVKTVK